MAKVKQAKPVTPAELKKAYTSGMKMSRVSQLIIECHEAVSICLPDEEPYTLTDSWRGLMLTLLKALQSKYTVKQLYEKMCTEGIGGGLRVSSLYTVEADEHGDVYPLVLGDEHTGVIYVHCDYNEKTFHSNISKMFNALGIDSKEVLVILHKNSVVDKSLKEYKAAKKSRATTVIKSIQELLEMNEYGASVKKLHIDTFKYTCKSYLEACIKLMQHMYELSGDEWASRVIQLNMDGVISVMEGHIADKSHHVLKDTGYSLFVDATTEDMLEYIELLCLSFGFSTDRVKLEFGTIKIM